MLSGLDGAGRDDELAGRDVGKEPEHAIGVGLGLRRITVGENDDLRVEQLHDFGQLRLGAHLQRAVEPDRSGDPDQRRHAVDAAALRVAHERERIGAKLTGALECTPFLFGAAHEYRQARGAADETDVLDLLDDDRLRTAGFN